MDDDRNCQRFVMTASGPVPVAYDCGLCGEPESARYLIQLKWLCPSCAYNSVTADDNKSQNGRPDSATG